MPTTSNFGWTTPADTDLVKDGAAAIRTLGNGIDTSFLDLKGGTTGQNLRKASNTDLDFTFAGDATNTVIDAEGDLLVGDSADTLQRLAIGTTGQVLTADTTLDGKIKWATPTAAALSVATFVDEKSNGTGGGSFTSGAWRTRTLQTTKGNTISGCSLSSNQIVLPAGTYNVQAAACVVGTVNSHQLKIYNITDSADILLGLTHYAPTDDVGDTAHLKGSFTLAAQKTIELQHRAQTTKNTYGFGIQASFGNAEVYAAITIIKES